VTSLPGPGHAVSLCERVLLGRNLEEQLSRQSVIAAIMFLKKIYCKIIRYI
jgi:hypothetical protein